MKKLDNRGFTLAELIVVIAILGILAGTLTASVGQIFSSQTRKFVNEYNALLSRCRVEMLSGAPASGTNVELGLGSDGQYYVTYRKGGEEKDTQKLSNKNVSCTFIQNNDPDTEAPIALGMSLYISFDRTTGAMSVEYDSDTVTATQIDVDIAGQNILLVPATGYHSIGG